MTEFIITLIAITISIIFIVSISIYLITDIKRTKKDKDEIKALENLNKALDAALEKIEKKNTNENIKENNKRKNYTTKKGEGYMSKYHNKLESLYKTLGTKYKLSIKEGKKGTIILVVEDSENKSYEVKFNSRKFNEASNTIIIAKIKKAIKGE